MDLIKIIDNLYCQPFFGRIFRSLVYCLKRELTSCDSVLDLGCGYASPIKHCEVKHKVGVDISKTDLLESMSKRIHDRYFLEDIRNIRFKKKSFDVVILIDVIEHLEKEEAIQLLSEAEKWSRKKVIVSTPNGFLPQAAEIINPFQLHRSGWNIDELEKRGYKVYGTAGWKKLRKQGDGSKDYFNPQMLPTVKFKPRLFWLMVSLLSEIVVYYFPAQAYELFCVKIQKQ